MYPIDQVVLINPDQAVMGFSRGLWKRGFCLDVDFQESGSGTETVSLGGRIERSSSL